MAARQILTGAVVRTADRAHPTAEAVAFEGGRVLAVGTTDEVLALRDADTEVRGLDGLAVYPGFVDVHNHHSQAGRADLYELELPPGSSLDDILERVHRHAASLPPDAWVIGSAYSSTMLGELSHTATRRRLDEASGGRPVMIVEDSRHNRWVNTHALRLAGITRDTQPAAGVTVLDDEDGEPTGVLLEAAGLAVEDAYARSGGLGPAEQRRSSQRGVEMLNAYGITAFQDAAADARILAALQSLDDAGELNAWVVSSLAVNDEIFGYPVVGRPLLDQGETFRSTHHRPDFAKIFLDGVPPARTASFLQPYVPDTAHGAHFHGTTTMDEATFTDWLRLVAAHGLGAKVHCTGDGSAHLLLDVVERLRAEGVVFPVQIAHGQFLAEADIPRMARLGVVADISPFVWFPGVIPAALADVLGADRAAHLQPNRLLTDAGVLVAGGSDWPVSASPNPLEGMQGLVTRADPLGRAPGVLWPEQAVTAAEALEIFTINAARAMGLGEVTGSLEPGKSADVVILDRDVVAGPADEIVQARVVETWFAGRRVH